MDRLKDLDRSHMSVLHLYTESLRMSIHLCRTEEDPGRQSK